MRVLHLPSNIASIPSHNVRAQRSLGIDAVGYAIDEGSDIVTMQNLEPIPRPRRRHVHKWTELFAWYVREVRAADLVHWYYDTRLFPWNLDLDVIRLLKKPAVVQWLGSEVRDPAVERNDNPYYARALLEGYEYKDAESTAGSHQTQRRFLAAGFVPLACPGIWQYLLPDAQSKALSIERGLDLDEYEEIPPLSRSSRPSIVHAPSAPSAKGTPYVLEAVDRLAQRLDFDFTLLEGVERGEALETLRRADLFVDQLIVGDYGMASIEAMALGKPVVCHIKPTIGSRYPATLPIIDATPDTIEATIERLLSAPDRLRSLGAESRRYAMEFHEASRCARQMARVYEKVISRHLPRGG